MTPTCSKDGCEYGVSCQCEPAVSGRCLSTWAMLCEGAPGAHESCPRCMMWSRCADDACDHPACEAERWRETRMEYERTHTAEETRAWIHDAAETVYGDPEPFARSYSTAPVDGKAAQTLLRKLSDGKWHDVDFAAAVALVAAGAVLEERSKTTRSRAQIEAGPRGCTISFEVRLVDASSRQAEEGEQLQMVLV